MLENFGSNIFDHFEGADNMGFQRNLQLINKEAWHHKRKHKITYWIWVCLGTTYLAKTKFFVVESTVDKAKR